MAIIHKVRKGIKEANVFIGIGRRWKKERGKVL